MSTTRGYPAPSRSSTLHVVDVPVALLTTVISVPKGSVGLAHIPDGASAYQVASPTSEFVGAWWASWSSWWSVVVVVVPWSSSSEGAGGDVVVVVGVGVVVVVVAGGAVVVVVVGGLVRDQMRPQVHTVEMRCGVHGRRVCAVGRCVPPPLTVARSCRSNNRRGDEEQRAANDCSNAEAPPPRALVPQGSTLLRDTAHPRLHTGGGGFLKNLDNRSRAAQTRKVMEPFWALFPQVTPHAARDI